ncbi:MAG: bifunctional nuclease family protein, partial [Nitrospirota bacterium]|nr:bifunctional nuclease family protein [Nitrospirota bacterium]
NIIDSLKVKVTKIVVTEILDNTYYALVCLSDGKKETLVDSRPSDAVAVALRASSPIFVEDSIMERKSADELEEWLKNLRPEDFGNII